MIPHPSRSDWFIFDRDFVLSKISSNGVPGLQFQKNNKVYVHRSHLPLLDVHPKIQSVDLIINEPFHPRPYQYTGIDYIRSRTGSLLNWQQRMGKTCVLAYTWQGKGPMLVAAPLAVRPVWMDWITKTHPNVKAVFVTGREFDPIQVKGADFIFCHYDILNSWTSAGLGRLELFVCDEAHVLQNSQATRSKAALAISLVSDRAVMATATPFWSNPSGLYSLLNIMSPGAWGNYTRFTESYASGHKGEYGWVTGEVSNEKEFKLRLIEVVSRLRWEDVVNQLPQRDISLEIVDLSNKQRLELDKLRTIIEVESDGKKLAEIGIGAKLRKLVGSLKAKTAVECAERILLSDEDVVVWAWHEDTVDEIHKGLIKKGFISFASSGSSEHDDVGVAQEKWKKSGASALVLSIGVGQVGIDLSKSRHSVFCELDYTPTTMDQARMRTFSLGKPLTETFIIADHDIDRRLVATVLRKCEQGRKLGIPAAELDVDILRQAFRDEESSDLTAVLEGLK